MKERTASARHMPVRFWPSHTPFKELISYCTQGRSHPVLKSGAIDDHVAELCSLVLDDVAEFLCCSGSPSEGQTVCSILQGLDERVHRTEDLQAAKLIYAIAVEASDQVLSLYLRHRNLFDQIAPHRKTLPCLASIHPKTAKVVAQMRADARLGSKTNDAGRIRSRAYFISDKPANVYARAIIEYVYFNRRLDSIDQRQRSWQKFDRQERVRTIVLPFPKHLKEIEKIPVPIAPGNVLGYWRKGKEVIKAEMPDFHLRPEWQPYRTRNYGGGGKKGAIQHAILKDVLLALRAIAGRR